jgi:hypothetical protein
MSNVHLIKDNKLSEDDAFASVTLNPTLRWLKFILTDDQPNGNKQRIPQDEFGNLIKSGINMPIKMAAGDIADGHENSFAIGVITNLKKVGNKIEGLAALWSKERPEDIDIIINEFEAGTPPQISWEVPYTDEEIDEEGISSLRGIILRAATLVRRPAFQGRTPILAVAAEQVTEPTETDSIKEDSKMTDEQLKKLEDQLAEATVKLSEATEKIADLEGQLKEKEDGFASIEEELTGLREFKAQIEKTDAEAEKLASVRAKFAEAEIEKPDEYFVENKDRFLSLEEEEVDFMVQEMSAFARLAQASVDTDGDDGEEQDEGLPAIVNTDGSLDLSDPKKLGQMLRLREAEKAKK